MQASRNNMVSRISLGSVNQSLGPYSADAWGAAGNFLMSVTTGMQTLQSYVSGLSVNHPEVDVGSELRSFSEVLGKSANVLIPALEIEAYIPNSDIGFVSVGQEAVIKVEAFPFTRYGIISGHVTEVELMLSPNPMRKRWKGNRQKSCKA